MTTYYIDYNLGSDANGNGTESAPRKTIPTGGADGDVYRFKRGSTYSVTGQLFYWPRQGVILTDYGNPAAPKPILSSIMASGASALNFVGDTIAHNINFSNIQRSNSETTSSNVGQNCLYFGPRGGASPGTVEGVSGVVIDCDFNRIGNNAIVFNGAGSDANYAYGAPVGIVIGCTFDDLGGDGIYGSVRDYMEVGWCKFNNLGTRIDASITGLPPGARQSASDAINTIYSAPAMLWLHDNFVDHSHWDCKHCFMIDAPASGQPNSLAIIERNILIGYGAGSGQPFAQSVNNVGINTEIRSIIRSNYIRGSRILLNVASQVDWLEAYGNIFHVLGVDGTNAALTVLGDGVSLNNNTIYGEGFINGYAVAKSSGADKFAARRNLLMNFSTGFNLSNPVQATYGRNAFYNVTSPYVNGVTPLTADAADQVLLSSPIETTKFTPSDANLLFRSVERRTPDFWGRFSPNGVGYIGAVLGAF